MRRPPATWRLLPAQELGCGSPATAWRRLAAWAKAGVFEQLHLELLDQLGEQGLVGLVAGQRGLGQRWTTWTQIQSIVASLDPSFTLFARAAACR